MARLTSQESRITGSSERSVLPLSSWTHLECDWVLMDWVTDHKN